MPDRVVPGPLNGPASIRQAVCVNTRKIFDSCRDKDCVDELRVYPSTTTADYIAAAVSVRPRSAELLYVDINVEPISFNRGYYTVDCTYYYRINGETVPAGNAVTGLSVFDKRVMLFGSEGSVKYYDSAGTVSSGADMPIGVVNSVDPIALHMNLVDTDTPGTDIVPDQIPQVVLDAFPDGLLMADTPRRLYVTIGQFSIIRLERDTQLLIPAYDYCMPDKDCVGSAEDDPCTLFGRIDFPVDEFFPPDSIVNQDDYRSFTS